MLQLTSCYYATIGGIYLSACRVSRGLLGGIEQAYMKGAFDTAAIAVFSACTLHVIFFHSLPSRIGCYGAMLVPYMSVYSFILGRYPFFILANTFSPLVRLFFLWRDFFLWRNFFFSGATFFLWRDFFFSGATFFSGLTF